MFSGAQKIWFRTPTRTKYVALGQSEFLTYPLKTHGNITNRIRRIPNAECAYRLNFGRVRWKFKTFGPKPSDETAFSLLWFIGFLKTLVVTFKASFDGVTRHAADVTLFARSDYAARSLASSFASDYCNGMRPDVQRLSVYDAVSFGNTHKKRNFPP